MEKILAPSILSADFKHLEQDIKATVDAGAKYIHFDVMDGVFVPNLSFGVPVLESLRSAIPVTLDAHLMIVNPENLIPAFAKAGADIITFHLEAAQDAEAVLRQIKSLGVRTGVSINPDTPIDGVLPLLDMGLVDMVLVMSVFPGFGGQKFIEDVMTKITALRAYSDAKNMDLDIEVDGGISAANVARVIEAGANVIVAGSAVFKGDIAQNTKAILENM